MWRNKFMHTATNFYLFNLAVLELMLLLSIIGTRMPSHLPMQFVYLVVVAETATNATVLTITEFTIESYIAVFHPLR
ncbi:pyrokinin-1 receptor-like [Bactrocera tryoni]|uniref:pyrokinin-1 receptor-like n=1 Tax=Bactrocera tryoni TaxID=59916 RepID=UPI001A970BF2|nr:pyrokinin-1 receptor-like [Bactrocera tryoni]